MSLPEILAEFAQLPELVVLLVLMGGAAVEYVFPPFPGDTVTLAGAVLVTSAGWHLAPVFLAVTAGSLAGALLDFYVGVWWLRRRRRSGGRLSAANAARLERLVAGFRRHGEVYLVVNRFLPGVRALFFVAAGLAEMRPLRVAVFATVSAAAWNGLILGVGFAIGRNLDSLESLFTTYSTAAWLLVGVVALGFVARWWWSRRRGRRSEGVEKPEV